MPPGQTIWSGWQYQDLTGNREVKSEEFTDAAVSTAKRRNGETGKRGNGETGKRGNAWMGSACT